MPWMVVMVCILKSLVSFCLVVPLLDSITDLLQFHYIPIFQGFDHHVRNEHNMWSYVFFFIHLDNMKQSDYTAVELYVSRLVGITL